MFGTGWFSRLRLGRRTPKVNVQNQRPADPQGMKERGGKWNDKISPHQPYTVKEGVDDVTKIGDRFAQSRFSFPGWQFSHGISEKILSKTPYPFTYAKPVQLDEGNDETANDGEVSEGDSEELEGKPVSKGVKNPKRNAFPNQSGSMELPNKDPLQDQEEAISPISTKFEIRKDLVKKYHDQWRQLDARGKDMFFYLIRSFGWALGINSSYIVKTKGVDDKPAYWVFSGEKAKKIIGKNRIPTKVVLEWPSWGEIFEERKADGVGVALNTADKEYELGKDAVMICPIPSTDSPRGEPYITPIWDTIIYKGNNRFLHGYWMWKGGKVGEYFRIPRGKNSDTYRKRLELQSKKPLGGEGVTLEYPAGKNPDNVDKMFDHEFVLGQDLNWEEANSLNSQDSPYPESFVKGNVESGALGGLAPKVDKQKEDEELLRMFRLLDPIVKAINMAFFDATEEEMADCIVIPWQDEEEPMESETESESVPEVDAKEIKMNAEPEVPSQPQLLAPPVKSRKEKTLKFKAKKNSVTEEGLTVYVGNLFNEGWLPQDDGTQEWLDASEIKKFVDDPRSVKEGYMQWEHPAGKPEEILKSSATARYKVVGYDKKNKRDITEFYVYTPEGPNDIEVSPMYYSLDVARPDGKLAQTELDVRNAVFTSSPRSKGRTKAKKL